jgi:UDP-N-acetylglucosamine 2-epimerase (non-hydrolysing)
LTPTPTNHRPPTDYRLLAEVADEETDHQPSSSTPEIAEPVEASPAADGGRVLGPSATKARLVVPIIVGTRPEAIKLVPIIRALRASDSHQPIVISTGQHHRMVQEIFDLAEIQTDVTLWAGTRRELNERVTSVMSRFEDFFIEWFGIPPEPVTQEHIFTGKFPAAVLVHGDTSSAMAAALAAFHLRIPVMHVEAGLRTGGLNLTPFPEELNRQVISCIACMHFAPTAANLECLINENTPVEQVFVTGNTGIDALRWASGLDCRFDDPRLQAVYDSDDRMVIVTAHRRENWSSGLDGIAAGVGRLARSHPEVHFVVPLHPNPLVREKLGDPLRELDNVLLIEPLGYAHFARMLARCHFVITDSGGIQEEAPSLGKPVLVTRESTERNEGVDAGTLLLVGTDPDKIVFDGERLLTDAEAYAAMSEAENPYGDGRAADRIVAALEHLLHGANAPVPFGPGYSRRAVIRAAGHDGPVESVETVLARIGEIDRREQAESGDQPWLL